MCSYTTNESIDVLQEIKSIEEGEVFLWLYTEIKYFKNIGDLITSLEDIKINLQLVQLRIFNENKELKIWRAGDKLFNSRLRTNDDENTYEESVFILNTTKNKNRTIVVRNYFDENAGYVDDRFVKLEKPELNG